MQKEEKIDFRRLNFSNCLQGSCVPEATSYVEYWRSQREFSLLRYILGDALGIREMEYNQLDSLRAWVGGGMEPWSECAMPSGCARILSSL